MSDSPITPISDIDSDVNSDVARRMAALERQVTILLVALILVTGVLALFFYRQSTNLRKDYDAMYPQAKQMVDTYNQNSAAIQRFVKEVAAYGQTHKEVQPLLAHYGLGAPTR